jgi:hypothetical protein
VSEVLEPIGSGEEWTGDQFASLVDAYERKLAELGYTPVRYPDREAHVGGGHLETARFDSLNHAYWMCGCIRRFLREQRHAKAYRWVGMVRGLLFMGGVWSLEELAELEQRAAAPAPHRVRDVVHRPTEGGDV